MLCNEATLSAVFTCGMAQRRWQGSWRRDWSERENCRLKIEKGATAAPLFLTGEVSLAFLAGLLLPALGFLCHCLLSPPSSGIACQSACDIWVVAAAWHAHSISGTPRLRSDFTSSCSQGMV